MKKLKIKSPLNLIILILFLISVVNTINKVNTPPKSIYKEGNKETTGIIQECTPKENKTTIILKSKEKIIVNYQGNFKCNLGDKIKVKGTLEKTNSNTIPNLFNYQKYLYSKKISYQMKSKNLKIIEKNKSKSYLVKNNLKKHIEKYKSKSYLNTFVLGNTKEINEDVFNSYKNNGISHLLAISGMHVTLLSAILLFLLNKISKYKKTNYLIVILILMFYIFLTNFTPSVIRAVSLFVAVTIKKIFKLKTETIYFLILICSIYLLYNPYIIYNIGFLFSFIITFFLILYSENINKKKTYLGKLFTTSLIAFLASIPILINNFFEINLLSPFINLIFVPLVSIIIYPLSLLSLFIKPLDIILFNITNIMEKLSLIISDIAIFKITLKHISVTFIIIYYLIIIYVLNTTSKRIVILLLILFIHNNINYVNPNTTITALDVGQGDSTLLSFKNNKGNILIDTGGRINSNYSIVKNKTIPYFKSRGIKKLDYAILTHGDYDHIGESINLVSNFKVEKVIFNCGPYNNLEKKLIKVLDKKKIKYNSCINEIKINKNKLYFLKTKKYNNENDNSNVVYTKINNYKFMLMGDAGTEKEKDILNKYNINNIDVLKTGHHGSKTSSSEEFINETNPKYSIISVGKNNRYGHPNKEVLNNLSNSKIYRTDQDGSVMFKIKNNKIKIKTCS